MSKNDKLTAPNQDLKENFDRVYSVEYSLGLFKSGSGKPALRESGECFH